MAAITQRVLTKCYDKLSWVPTVYNLSGTPIEVSFTTYDTRSQVDTPDYWRRRQKGENLPVNPYSRSVATVKDNQLILPVSYSAKEAPKTGGYTEWETYSGGVPMTLSTMQAFLDAYSGRIGVLRNEAKAKMSDHIANVQWQLPVDLAELDKTASMVGQRFFKTVKFLQDFRRSRHRLYRDAARALSNRGTGVRINPKKLRELANSLNQAYLEFTYGWNPLAGSVEDAVNYFVDRSNKYFRRKVSGHAFFGDVRSNKTLNYPLPGSGLAVVGLLDNVRNVRYDVWAGGLFTVEYVSSDRDKLSLQLTEVPAVLWELTSFSFLADYFINIGDVINNLRANFRLLNQSTMYLSEKFVVEQSVRYEQLRFNDPSLKLSFTSKSFGEPPKVRMVNFTRSPLTYGQALVTLNLKTPSSGNLFNTLSVLAQATGALGRTTFHAF